MGYIQVSLGHVLDRARADQPFFEALVDDAGAALQGQGWSLSATDHALLGSMVQGALEALATEPDGILKPWP